MLHFKLLIAAVALILSSNGFAQNANGSRTVNKSTEVPADVTIHMNNHSGDVKIST